uniref:Effector protein n=1 Tax=Globodera pallida TaxID=36090 RepID=A0A183BLV1_GLOPA
MTLALPTMLFSTFAGIAFMQLFLGLSDGAVTCNLDGCAPIAKVAPSKNCCNKVYTSPYAKCPIPGWRANGYKGNVPVDIKAPSRKRDAGCSDSNRCPSGYKCVAYKKGNSNGFCWRGPQGDAGNSSFALAILIAGLVVLL